ncbi:dihydrofolate reductase [Liquorilactobacillus nagelii]|jgi:dihydrofolate reductase|uniref:dihydrofolate reductase n=1 Tax=Liquorilactobacillus nagelii TaxID=82688 RepID=UPI002431CAF1|nr:dihydrofolate reductase [Liquorilactobacillus nagelii]MCI1632496.1 dihydrofolate reductase [Liquorilactobacillus nagelii]
MLAYIWAEDLHHQIGFQGHLPWYLPADLAHFKRVTQGYPMIMGRKTFASLPGILPGRPHYVLTSSSEYDQKYATDSRVKIFHTTKQLVAFNQSDNQLKFIIGGASLFAAFADQVDLLYVTKIAAAFKGDVKMPSLPWSEFDLVWAKKGRQDQQNKYPHQFKLYSRRTSKLSLTTLEKYANS